MSLLRSSALLVALILPVTRVVALPPEVEAVRAYLPSETRLLLHLRLDTPVRDALMGLFPVNPQVYRELVLVETAKLKEKHGFDPGEDLAGVVFVLGAEGNSLAGSMFAVGKKPMDWIFTAFGESRTTAAKTLTVAGVKAMQSDDMIIALPEPTIALVGSLEKVGLALDKKGPKADVAGRLTALESSRSTAPMRLVLFPTPEQLNEIAKQGWMQTFGGSLVTRVTWAALEVDLERVSLVLGFPEEGAATAAASQFGGVIEALKGMASSAAASLEGASENPVDRLDPESLVGRVLARTAQDVLAVAKGEARGLEAALTVPLSSLKVLEGPLSVPLLASMAVKIYQQRAGGAVPPAEDEQNITIDPSTLVPPPGEAIPIPDMFGTPASPASAGATAPEAPVSPVAPAPPVLEVPPSPEAATSVTPSPATTSP